MRFTTTHASSAQQIACRRQKSPKAAKGSRLNCRRKQQRAAAGILQAAEAILMAHAAERRRNCRPEDGAASQTATARAQQQQMPLQLSSPLQLSCGWSDGQVKRHHLPAWRQPPCHRSSLQSVVEHAKRRLSKSDCSQPDALGIEDSRALRVSYTHIRDVHFLLKSY